MLDLKLIVGLDYSDLQVYFMVQWFCLIFCRLFDEHLEDYLMNWNDD